MLARISESEKRLEILKRKNEEHNKKYNTILEELGDFVASKPLKKSALDEQFKELANIEDKSKKVELIREKSYNWAIKLLKKLEKVQNKKNTNLYSLYPRDKLPNLFEAVNTNLVDLIAELNEENIEESMYELTRDKDYVDENYLKKNVRVKGKKLKKKQKEDQQSQGSKHSDSYADDFTDDEELDDENENHHFMNVREEIKSKKK